MPTAESVNCDDVGDVPDDELRAAQLLWTSSDSPWVHTVDRSRNLATVVPLPEMNPALILSIHLPQRRVAPRSSSRRSLRLHPPLPPTGRDQASLHHHRDSIGSANGLHMRVVD